MANSRRTFLKNIGAGSLSATLMPLGISSSNDSLAGGQRAIPSGDHQFNGSYTNEFLNRIAFPLGGIGAGMFCIEGTGSFSHMSIRHKPDVFSEPGLFAAIAIEGQPDNGAKILEGPSPDWKKFGQVNAGNGQGGTTYGLPRFEVAEFNTRFPFESISLRDKDYPLTATIEAWSPFIPTDADNSSLPAAAISYKVVNTSSSEVKAVFSFHAKNFLKRENEPAKNFIERFPNGFVLRQDASTEKEFLAGSFAIYSDEPGTVVDHCWFRGGWFDAMTMTWNVIKNAGTRASEPVPSDAPGASLYVPIKLGPGESKEIIIHTNWYVPASELKFGDEVNEQECNDQDASCCNTSDQLGEQIADPSYTKGNYKPWYSARFKDVSEVSQYWKSNYASLKQNSSLFSDAFYSSTLPPEVLEAIAANLTIIKSPTVLRQYDGRLWSFEGCGDSWGCCHGSCTHVWNYAQAIPHLFPRLERTLRHTEFCENQNQAGHQTFRASLPIRPLKHDFHAAADGQLGGIMKVYRDWRISGDTEWMKKMYPLVKASLSYCQQTWDPKMKGIIEEPHHNTYDIEFWGPDGMCTSFYLGALSAAMEMAKALKKKQDVNYFSKLYESGRPLMEKTLFDGEYFIQKIQTKGLNADPFAEGKKSMVGEYSEEAKALFEKEGPKYQYGSGCLSDGVLGVWIARMCGLKDPIDTTKVKSHLEAVYKYNFKTTLEDHANPQRPTFAFGTDGGLLLCSWPKGGKLSLPFVYSDEVWTGIEYQVASHLILSGQVEKGLDIVKACRKRYDGRVRNPFNEYECGHWYARALASYGLIQALTGLRFDAVEKTLYVDSQIGDFTSFISTETGFGTVTLKGTNATVKSVYGSIPVNRILVNGKEVKG
jgi:uncharacterized protein (DUF608 family)